MSKIFFTSDTHWFHENIIKYSNRPWQNVDAMTNGLIKNWNGAVGKNDIVYHLGDVAMGGKGRLADLKDVLFKLNGNIRLIKGNHDDYILNQPCLSRFEWVKDYFEFKYVSREHGKRKFVLMHFPLYTWHHAHRKTKDGLPYSIHLHGHCHGNIDQANLKTTRMDVGVDSNQYAPIWIENIIEIMNYRTYDAVDHHKNSSHKG